MKVIDLRSDTMTQPTPAMRRAMADAEVGDDVYGEDPTINRLQQEAAAMFGREAALFVPSGTMANQISIKIYTEPGQEVICEQRAHVYTSELGMMSAFAGCMVRPIWAEDGILTWDLLSPKIRKSAMRYGGTGLITLENTANFAGGTVYSAALVEEICRKAHQIGLPVFLDGARIFNAAVALNVATEQLTKSVDSFMFSLSKGLGAPVGSVLLGTSHFIAEARHLRKMFGGAMRQAGILAAAGLVALQEGPSRLHVDHENAKFLAAGLAEMPGLEIAADKVATNIVVANITRQSLSAADLTSQLKARGVLANAIGLHTIRLVTHRDVTRAECEKALQLIREVLNASVARV
jgi:threonine aldolase